MSKSHTLIEIREAFDSLHATIRDGRPIRGLEISRLFNDLDLSLSQAKVLAWLMEHKDSIYPILQMCDDLHIEEENMNKIIDSLLEARLLERNGEDIDVSDSWLFTILDYQAARDCGLITSWSDYYTPKRGNQPENLQYDDEDEPEDGEDPDTSHIIQTKPFWKVVKEIADEEALERMDDFDPLETEGDTEDTEDSEEYDD